MKYTTGTFRAGFHLNSDGWADMYPLSAWEDMQEEVVRVDGQKCRVLDCGLEGYVDLEFLDGSLLEAVSRGHVFF